MLTESKALSGFAALSNAHRLRLFRLLIQEGPGGLAAGDLARSAGLSPSAASFHLAQLESACLVRSCRIGRRIFYVIDVSGTRALVTFLTQGCCSGFPEFCGFLERLPLEDKTKGIEIMTDKTYNVLFLCTGNSARSIMAEAVLNDLSGDGFRGFSAGSMPKGQVHPYALDLLRNQNYKTDDLRSKSWEEFEGPEAPNLDFVFTLCDQAADESCPIWPGRPMTAHWGLPDPAAADGNEAVKRAAFADALRMLNNRIGIFINLPVASLDKLTLQKRLNAIGQTASHETKEPA